MIAKCSSGKNFRALGAYLATGRHGNNPDRVAWSAGRNLPTDDPRLAAKIMQATAAQNHRVKKPVYHLSISFDPTDPVTRAQMEQVSEQVLARLGLHEHQTVIVAHRDTGHPHIHLFVNRSIRTPANHGSGGRITERSRRYFGMSNENCISGK
jgi:Relaxase/Mobilisation nuclease domain